MGACGDGLVEGADRADTDHSFAMRGTTSGANDVTGQGARGRPSSRHPGVGNTRARHVVNPPAFRRHPPTMCLGVAAYSGPVTGMSTIFAASVRWSPRGDLLRLQDPYGIPERVADAHVRAVEMISRLLREVGDAAVLERLVQRPGVVRCEDETGQGTLGDQLADLLGRRVVVRRRPRLLERDLRAAVAGDTDGQPAVGSPCLKSEPTSSPSLLT